MLETKDPPPCLNVAGNQVAQLLHLCEQLHTCSDEELWAQLQQLAFAHPEHLVQSVRLVLHSSKYISQQRAASPAPAKTAALALSAREKEILTLLGQGYTLPRIGERLFISPATVNNHCARMREKLGLQGCKSLTVYALSA